MRTPTTCTACGATLEREGRRWIDTQSGDEGGTYDVCPMRYDERTNTQRGHAAPLSALTLHTEGH